MYDDFQRHPSRSLPCGLDKWVLPPEYHDFFLPNFSGLHRLYDTCRGDLCVHMCFRLDLHLHHRIVSEQMVAANSILLIRWSWTFPFLTIRRCILSLCQDMEPDFVITLRLQLTSEFKSGVIPRGRETASCSSQLHKIGTLPWDLWKEVHLFPFLTSPCSLVLP